MPTQCNQEWFGFARAEGRAVVASFDGGRMTSDAGALLLGATDRAIRLRADSAFAREALMAWCEANGVDYLFGLARNARLVAAIAGVLAEAADESRATGKPARRFKDFREFLAFMAGAPDGRLEGARKMGVGPRLVNARLGASYAAHHLDRDGAALLDAPGRVLEPFDGVVTEQYVDAEDRPALGGDASTGLLIVRKHRRSTVV